MRINETLKDSQSGRKSSSRPTRTILGRALYLSIETGALTGAVFPIIMSILPQLIEIKATLSTLYLILWSQFPHEYYHMAFAFIMGKIYANSLMAIFNSRVVVSDLRDEPRFIDSMDSIAFHRSQLACRVERLIEVPDDTDSISKPPMDGAPPLCRASRFLSIVSQKNTKSHDDIIQESEYMAWLESWVRSSMCTCSIIGAMILIIAPSITSVFLWKSLFLWRSQQRHLPNIHPTIAPFKQRV